MIGGESDTLGSVFDGLKGWIVSLSLSMGMNGMRGRERMKGKDIGRVGVLDR